MVLMRPTDQPSARVATVMKAETDNPEPLRKALREWRVTAPLPPRFQERVWQKIQQTGASGTPAETPTVWALFQAWLEAALPRPAVATAYLGVLLLAGVAAGRWQARQTTARLESELGARYVQSVDPYQRPSRN